MTTVPTFAQFMQALTMKRQMAEPYLEDPTVGALPGSPCPAGQARDADGFCRTYCGAGQQMLEDGRCYDDPNYVKPAPTAPGTGWGPVANSGMYAGVPLPPPEFPSGGGTVANDTNVPPGYIQFEDGGIIRAPEYSTYDNSYEEMLGGVFGGGGSSTFTPYGG